MAEHGRVTSRGTSTQAQRLSDSWPYWELESVPPILCPYLAGETSLRWQTIANQYISQCGYRVAFYYRQNVVIVGAGRFSRSARFATSSELLSAVQYAERVLCRI